MKSVILYLTECLLLTCTIEAIVCLFLKNKGKWLGAGLICNIITNPAINIILLIAGIFTEKLWLIYLLGIILEIAVLFAETALYKLILKESFRKCIAVSAMCNTLSFLSGIIISVFI